MSRKPYPCFGFGFGVNSGQYTPNAISGLVAWYDPAYGPSVTVDSANLVSQVNDRSSAGSNATAATTARPTLSYTDIYENLVKYSEDVTNAAWVAYGTTTARPAANQLQTTAVTNSQGIYQSSAGVNGATYRVRLKLKKGTQNYAWVGDTTGAAYNGVNVDMNAGAIDATTNIVAASSSIAGPDGDGFYTVIFKFVADTATPILAVTFSDATRTSPLSKAWAGTENFYCKEIQLQKDGADTTYVSTTSAQHYSGVNGKSTLVFDGVANVLSVATNIIGVATAQSIVAAGRIDGAQYGGFLVSDNGGDANIDLSFADSRKLNWRFGTNYALGVALTLGTPFIATLTTTGTDGAGYGYLNGTLATLTSGSWPVTPTAPSAPATTNAIGKYRVGTALFGAQTICEILVYNHALDSGERAYVETYLKRKWATP